MGSILARVRAFIPAVTAGRQSVGLYRFGHETLVVAIEPTGEVIVARSEESPSAVKAAMRERGIRSMACRVVVRSGQQVVRVFDVPPIRSEKDVAGAAMIAMKAEFRKDPSLGLTIDDVIVHHQILAPKRLLVGAVPRKTLADLRSYAKACGLDVAGVDGEGFTLLAAAPEEADSLLYVDGAGATLAARVNDEPREFYFEGAGPINWAPALLAQIREFREQAPHACRSMGYSGPMTSADDDATTLGASVLDQVRERLAAASVTLLPVGVPSMTGAAYLEPECFLAWALASRGLS